jgi:hypothetical protein
MIPMDTFFIMIAPELVVVLSIIVMFVWGSKGKERI